MSGDLIKFKRLDMGERLGFNKTRNRFQGSACARADDYIRSPEQTSGSIVQRDLQSPGADETPGTQDQFCPALLEVVEVDVHEAGDHLALAVADSRHIDGEAGLLYTELLTSLK